ncbi:MAG: desulfoferrodoxin [Acidobacteria bacterium]|nr:desulfoferrodoxin [Acidobacteriota bacterium]
MPTDVGEEYICEKCGAVVVVVQGGFGYLVCCDQVMKPK